ncbi:RAS signaling inhibitor ST5 [Phytophthora cinnamomi]|uniref:RAS signaling inhibitor ST5 n=1 Tax=Phytophthora cinnamomi TaxID=4785 RepID=UPI00355A256A|nr:RAS signaling inhibitor ST5 [Phytophthora cinnamomi]
MSDSEEDSGSVGRQKSIFSGMGRVKQINHLREKWSPKPKSPLPDRTFIEPPPSSPWIRRPSPEKYPQGPYSDNGRRTLHRAQSVNGSPRRQPVVTVVDMERYLAINTWLEHNGINVAQINTAVPDKRGNSKDYGLFDDMFSSLDVLENSLMNELSYLSYGSDNRSEGDRASIVDKSREVLTLSPPALFDYLVVIAPDMVDVTIRNFWNLRENVFEATVAFAYPPESQFRVESLEHFCFPTGIKATTVNASTGISIEKSGDLLSENPPSASREGDFFVLMISGGGVQGQSVQYAMCMKGMVQIRNGGDDGKSLMLPICYCIVAQIPLIPFFRAVLQGFLDNLRCDLESSTCSGCGSLSSIVTDKHTSYIDDTLQNLTKVSLPDKGLSLSVNIFPSPSPELVLTRPHKENDADEKILSLLLVEMKFIVVSGDIPLLSAATLGLASLLHPLGWAGPLISVLPPSMHEYMEAPVPLICGVDELPCDFECSKGTCILYLAESRVQLHVEDKRSFEALQMPEVEKLSGDLTRFTKEMLGRVTGSFRENVTPLSTHLVIHRFRRHIEHLISVCAHTRESYRAEESELIASEKRFVNVFKQTQMYQKYQDDQPMTATIDQSIHQSPSDQPVRDEVPTKMSSVNTQHDGLKSAASVLFQIALAGVSTLPRTSSRLSMTAKSVADAEEIETQNHEVVELPLDELESGSARLSSTAPSPTARIFFNMKKSPNEKTESPTRGQELISPTPSEQSAQADRPDRTFVWPLSQSELDIFWVVDEANAASPTVVSPGSAHRLVLHSPMSDVYESPRRSPNNESVSSYVDDPKSVTRSEHGIIVNAQRADTDTTISIFDAALSEALGSADTTDDAWLFDTSDDHILSSHHDNDSDEDRGTKLDSSPEEYATHLHDEESMKHESLQQNSPCNNPRRSWHQSMDDQNNDRSQTLESQEASLPPDQAKILVMGISIDSRGAWEAWVPCGEAWSVGEATR